MARARARTTDGKRRWVAPVVLGALVVGTMMGLVLCTTTARKPEPQAREVVPVAPRAPAGPRARGDHRSAPPSAASGASPAPASSTDNDDLDPVVEAATNLPTAPPPYPPWSQPLTEGSDPSSSQFDDDPVDAKSGIHVVWGPKPHLVHAPEPMVIAVRVLDRAGKALPVSGGFARFRPEKSTVEAGPWFKADFKEDGGGGYLASYTPSDTERPLFLKSGVHVYTEIEFEAPNNLGLRKYGSVLMYSRDPGGKLNGSYSDVMKDGSLVVNVGVEVTTSSKYRLIASLYGPDGQTAISYATRTEPLTAPSGVIPITFFGKTLFDKGIDGPYVVRYLMLFEQPRDGEEYPGPTVDNAHRTRFYRAKDFAPDGYKAPKPDFEVIDMNHPSQQNKPPPLFSDGDRVAQRQAPPSASYQAPPRTYTQGK